MLRTCPAVGPVDIRNAAGFHIPRKTDAPVFLFIENQLVQRTAGAHLDTLIAIEFAGSVGEPHIRLKETAQPILPRRMGKNMPLACGDTESAGDTTGGETVVGNRSGRHCRRIIFRRNLSPSKCMRRFSRRQSCHQSAAGNQELTSCPGYRHPVFKRRFSMLEFQCGKLAFADTVQAHDTVLIDDAPVFHVDASAFTDAFACAAADTAIRQRDFPIRKFRNQREQSADRTKRIAVNSAAPAHQYGKQNEDCPCADESAEDGMNRHLPDRQIEPVENSRTDFPEYMILDGDKICRRHQECKRKHQSGTRQSQNKEEKRIFDPAICSLKCKTPLEKHHEVLKNSERAQNRTIQSPDKQRHCRDCGNGKERPQRKSGSQGKQTGTELRDKHFLISGEEPGSAHQDKQNNACNQNSQNTPPRQVLPKHHTVIRLIFSVLSLVVPIPSDSPMRICPIRFRLNLIRRAAAVSSATGSVPII